MDSALPHAKLMYAPVLRWSDQFTEVYCPYCNEVHVHRGTKPEHIHQRRRPIRRARCRRPLLKKMGIRYQLKYPFDSYEIDKSNDDHQCFINTDRDVRIPDSKHGTTWIAQAPGQSIQSNPYAYEIQGEFPHEVVAPTDIDQVTEGLANLTISSGSNRPSIGNQDAPRSIVSPVIHIREISGLLDEAGHVRGCVGEISICIEREHHSDTHIQTLQISVISREPDDIKIFFGTPRPAHMYRRHELNDDIIYKHLKEVRFCALGRPLKSLVACILPPLGNDTYINRLERLLHRRQPPPSILPPHMTVTLYDTLHWDTYTNYQGDTYVELVRIWPSPNVIKTWPLATQFKTIAGLWREGNFSAVYAISGYGTPYLSDRSILRRRDDYPRLMIDILCHIGEIFPEDKRDQGVAGLYHSCHAEMQVLGYLVERHRTVVGLDDASWGKLKAIAPSGHLEHAIIGVSKRPCGVCRWALQKVCIAHKFRITVELVEDDILMALNYPHPE